MAIGFVLLFGLSSCEDKIGSYNIYSIGRETSIEGSFFLGSGSLDSVSYFIAWKQYGEGFKLIKANQDNSVIYEDNSVKPHIIYKINAFSGVTYYDIYVPTGTILKEFKL